MRGLYLRPEGRSFTPQSGKRIEIRGFGSFTMKERRARIGRNPKSGQAVTVQAKRHIAFKPSKELLWEH